MSIMTRRPWMRLGASLNVGREVITHTDSVSVPGWAGSYRFLGEVGAGAGLVYGILGGIFGANIIAGIYSGAVCK
jgi:hypothetical protein